MNPRVSVLLPVRNGLPWLSEALDSLSCQTLESFEILAIDDGSTDGTADFLSSWRDERLRVITTGGVGIAEALNAGLREARAPLVARQDADDRSAPDRLERQADFLARRTDVAVVATLADYIDVRGDAVDSDWVRAVRAQQDIAITPEGIGALMPLTCCITHGSVMARTGLLRNVGGYRQAMAPAEDYDLWLRLLPRTRFAKIAEALYTYRVHSGQVSAKSHDRQLAQTLLAKLAYIRRLCPDMPDTARLAVVGSGRGAERYRALASHAGFTVVSAPPALQRSGLDLLRHATTRRWAMDACDLLVVGDFADVSDYSAALLDPRHRDIVRVGNFFVPERWMTERTGRVLLRA